MDDAVVYLVPLGRNRYELYSEARDDDEPEPAPGAGFFPRQLERVRVGWKAAVHAARRGERSTGRIARWRHWAVSRIAESIAEQRTLWLLRSVNAVELTYPADLSESSATTLTRALLAHARRHHGIWVIVDGLLFVVLAPALFFVPGPNIVAYYFGLRAVGHLLSWRGARRGLDGTTWRTRPEPALAELAALIDEPRDESRATRVEAIASRLNLPRLAAFFDRAAVSGRPRPA